jgi:hypothetical protein
MINNRSLTKRCGPYSAVIPDPTELTPTAGFLIIVTHAAVAVIAGAAIMVRRDA